jgi:glycosyltransferase involved in cell wall biosynthesis
MSTISGLASIIVPSWNQLEFARQCIAALKSLTRPPWELIVINNGSTDHTDIYLAGVSDGAAAPVTVISNTKNLGFPAAINQGLKAARGEYLVMLNNDVAMTDGWLGQLIGLANAKKDVTAEHGESKTKEGTDGRPAVDSGAGSGDPRTARSDVRPAVDSGAGSHDPALDATRGLPSRARPRVSRIHVEPGCRSIKAMSSDRWGSIVWAKIDNTNPHPFQEANPAPWFAGSAVRRRYRACPGLNTFFDVTCFISSSGRRK